MNFLIEVISASFFWVVLYGTVAYLSHRYLPGQLIRPKLRSHESTPLTALLVQKQEPLLSDLVVANRTMAYFHCHLIFWGGLYLSWASPNSHLVDELLLASLSYFLTDAFYIVALEYNFTFLLHHLVCLSCWILALQFNTMKTEALEALWLAELTGLLWIPWETANKFGWNRLRKRLALPFMVLFTCVRGVYFPYYLLSLLPTIYYLSDGLMVRLVASTAVLLISAGGLMWTPKVIRKCLPDIL